MTQLVFYVLFAFGLAYVVGQSLISLRWRILLAEKSPFLTSLIECPACLGFWIGVAGGFIWGPPDWFPSSRIVWSMSLPFFTSATNYLLGRTTRLMEE